ncbi:glyoxalase [Microbispora rosea subsp. aerata]|nr:VOC family protein [Microbispora rosea]GGO21095.1 glyoxalase [Microbispora rosea subsp. aerata]GIH56131.1 glyoxalase [Microbispora rosea subsp. aerata]GLJ85696.1 glyoxalase [Microbispora rosea subsp. aerata]
MAAVTIDLTLYCENARLLAEFWKAALGYVDEIPASRFGTDEEPFDRFDLPAGGDEDGALLCDPEGIGPRLSIVRVPDRGRTDNRLHIDVRVPGEGSPADRWERIRMEAARLVRAGGTILEAFDDYILMADPEGNEFRVTAAPA